MAPLPTKHMQALRTKGLNRTKGLKINFTFKDMLEEALGVGVQGGMR